MTAAPAQTVASSDLPAGPARSRAWTAAGIVAALAGGLSMTAGSMVTAVYDRDVAGDAVAGLLGSGLTTEFVFGVSDPDLMVPEAAVFFGHWIGTIPWLWGGIGVTALAVAAASLRQGAAVPRPIGWVSLALGGLLTLIAVSPLQYMAGMVGPLWLLVASVALGLREQR